MNILVIEILLAVVTLYLTYTLQYLVISSKSISIDYNAIPGDLIDFVKKAYGGSINLKMWKELESTMLVMAALHTPPFKPLIIIDGRFLAGKIDVAKVFLAHEIGHLRRRSQFRVFVTAIIALTLVFIVSYFNDLLSLVLFPAVISAVFFIYRCEEFEADKYAVKLLGKDKVIEVYKYIEKRTRERKSGIPRNIIYLTIYVLRKIGVYPSIRNRIEKLSNYSLKTSK